ncbi:MAG: metallophosphoesterase family protein, partial [Nitrososphaerales archaeon]
MEDFLVFSDVHLHNWKYGSHLDSSGFNSRLLDQITTLSQIYGYAIEHSIADIFFAGDLFHTHATLHAGPLAAAHKFFSTWHREGITTWAIPGNHDIADQQGRITSLETLKESIFVRDQQIGNDPFYFLPYTSNPEKVKNFLDNLPDNAYAFMHSGVQKVTINNKGFILNDEILDPTWIPDRIKHAFIGHYHSFKTTPKWTIPGSPMHHGWADAGDSRGFLHISPDQDRILPIGLNYPHFKVLDGNRTI